MLLSYPDPVNKRAVFGLKVTQEKRPVRHFFHSAVLSGYAGVGENKFAFAAAPDGNLLWLHPSGRHCGSTVSDRITSDRLVSGRFTSAIISSGRNCARCIITQACPARQAELSSGDYGFVTFRTQHISTRLIYLHCLRLYCLRLHQPGRLMKRCYRQGLQIWPADMRRRGCLGTAPLFAAGKNRLNWLKGGTGLE